MVFSKDESKLYAQVSFFNGLVEYDLNQDKITRIAQLPGSSTILKTGPNGSMTRAIMVYPLVPMGKSSVWQAPWMTMPLLWIGAPYRPLSSFRPVNRIGLRAVRWQKLCNFRSETDVVTVIDFATGEKVRSVPVGNHPQRVRIGYVPADWSTP